MEKNKIITKKYFLFTGISKKDNYGIIMVKKLKNGYKDLKYGDKFVHMSGDNIINFPKCGWNRIKNLGFAEVIYHYGFDKIYDYSVDKTLIETGIDLKDYNHSPERIVFNWCKKWELIHKAKISNNNCNDGDDDNDDDYYDVYHPLSDSQSRANKAYQELLRSREENKKNQYENTY